MELHDPAAEESPRSDAGTETDSTGTVSSRDPLIEEEKAPGYSSFNQPTVPEVSKVNDEPTPKVDAESSDLVATAGDSKKKKKNKKQILEVVTGAHNDSDSDSALPPPLPLLPPPPPEDAKKKKRRLALGIGLSSAVALVLAFLTVFLLTFFLAPRGSFPEVSFDEEAFGLLGSNFDFENKREFALRFATLLQVHNKDYVRRAKLNDLEFAVAYDRTLMRLGDAMVSQSDMKKLQKIEPRGTTVVPVLIELNSKYIPHQYVWPIMKSIAHSKSIGITVIGQGKLSYRGCQRTFEVAMHKVVSLPDVPKIPDLAGELPEVDLPDMYAIPDSVQQDAVDHASDLISKINA